MTPSATAKWALSSPGKAYEPYREPLEFTPSELAKEQPMEKQPPKSLILTIIQVLFCYLSLQFIIDLALNIIFGKSIFALIYQASGISQGLLGDADTSTLKFFYLTSVAITSACWITLFASRFLRPAGVFIMPYGFEILMTLGLILLNIFILSCISNLESMNYASWDRNPEISRLLLYGSGTFGSLMMTYGWLGFVHLAFWGSEKERNYWDVMMRAYAFMKLPHEK